MRVVSSSIVSKSISKASEKRISIVSVSTSNTLVLSTPRVETPSLPLRWESQTVRKLVRRHYCMLASLACRIGCPPSKELLWDFDPSRAEEQGRWFSCEVGGRAWGAFLRVDDCHENMIDWRLGKPVIS